MAAENVFLAVEKGATWWPKFSVRSFLTLCFLTLFEPVAIAIDCHYLHPMGQPIQQRPGHPLVASERLRPLGER